MLFFTANELLYDRTSISTALVGEQEFDLLCDVLLFMATSNI